MISVVGSKGVASAQQVSVSSLPGLGSSQSHQEPALMAVRASRPAFGTLLPLPGYGCPLLGMRKRARLLDEMFPGRRRSLSAAAAIDGPLVVAAVVVAAVDGPDGAEGVEVAGALRDTFSGRLTLHFHAELVPTRTEHPLWVLTLRLPEVEAGLEEAHMRHSAVATARH